ncbi:MAG TPA: DUF5683 domain-containing protein [Chitinophagaceae bacterium]
MKAYRLTIMFFFCGCGLWSFAQDSSVTRTVTDTVPVTATVIAADTTATQIKLDTPRIRRHDPRIATRRSLILPGWGQAYNREYWKIPIVWGALGACAGIWVYNNNWYHRTRDAFVIVQAKDSANFNKIHPKLKYRDTGMPLDANSLQNYRNIFRRDRDYSLLYFIGAWALNVADATVFAHLKEFDVSDDLSVKVTPNLNPIARTGGLTLRLNIR